jgi:Protein of unknown function (DUF1059)
LEKVLQCDCGFEARAERESDLIAQVQRHAWEAHGMALSPDQALLLAFRAELDATSPARGSSSDATDDPSQRGNSKREEEE